MLCRVIVWDDIVLGSDEKGGKLSGSSFVKATIHYQRAIFRVTIIWG